MLRCANCGSLNADTNLKCGLCGGTNLGYPITTPQPLLTTPPQRNNSRLKAFAVLVVGIAALIEGAELTILQISASFTAIGFFALIFGAIMVLLPLGMFSNAPYRSGWMNTFERRRQARERKRYSD